jgi:pyridoxamine 5'-phosphate oxidase-like protein
MSFTDTELEYLSSQRLGRLATAQPDGTLQVSPVGFRHNSTTGTSASRQGPSTADLVDHLRDYYVPATAITARSPRTG